MPDGFKIASAWVEVKPDTAGFREKLQAEIDKAAGSARQPKAAPKVTLAADISQMAEAFDKADRQLAKLDKKTARPKITPEIDQLAAAFDKADRVLGALDGKKAAPKVTLDKTELDTKADEAKTKLDDLGGKKAKPKVTLDDGGFQEKLAADKAAADSAGGGFDSLHLKAVGIGAAIAAAAAALPGLGGALAGLGGALAVPLLAFSGVTDALKAYSQTQQAAGVSSAQLAATEFSNAVAIQNAQRAISDAQRQAQQDAITSAEAVAGAQMSLGDTYRQAADEQIQAIQALGNAEQALGNAEYNEQQAQVNLTLARQQAAIQLEQLNNQAKDAALGVKGAQLALEEAQRQQILTDQNAMSTQLDRERAALAVAEAEQRLTEAQQGSVNSSQAADRANKLGVEGSKTVVDAKHAQVLAEQAVANAQQALANAQRHAAEVQITAAEQIQRAVQALADAERNAANTRIKDAEAVQVAQQNLYNTQEQQQLQAAAASSQLSQAQNQLAAAMANMGPAGRALTVVLEPLVGIFQSMQEAAAKAVLGGVTVLMHGIQSALPVIMGTISQLGSAAGAGLAAIGRTLASSGFQQALREIVAEGAQFLRIFGPALGQMLGVIAQAFAGSAPAVTGLAQALAGLARGVGGIFAGLQQFAAPAGAFLKILGDGFAALGKPLGQVAGLVIQALTPVLRILVTVIEQLAPPFAQLVAAVEPLVAVLGNALLTVVQAVLSALQPVLPVIISLVKTLAADLAPVIAASAGLIAGLIKALAPLLPLAGQLLGVLVQVYGSAMRPLAAITQQLTPVIGQLVQVALRLLQEAVVPMLPLIRQSADSFGQLLTAMLPILPPVVQLATALLSLLIPVVPPLMKVLTALAGVFSGPLTGALTTVISWISKGIGWFLQLDTKITGVFRDIGAGALHLWHQVWDPMWAAVKPALDLVTLNFADLQARITRNFTNLQAGALYLWHQVFDPVWAGIKAGAQAFVRDLGVIWGGLEKVFKDPVNFLISIVYDKGIAGLWNDVVGAVGLGSIKLPVIAPLAAGGVIPGYAPGRDTVPAMLSPGEGVLVPEAVRGIGGAPAVHAINAAYGGHRGAGRQGDGTHFGGGGILGAIGGVLHDVFGGVKKAYDIGRIAAALMTGNSTALSNALDAFIGTHASGDLAKVMTGLPKTLFAKAAEAVVAMLGGGKGAGGGAGNVPGNVASWIAQGMAIAGVSGPDWQSGLSIIAMHESGGNPTVINTWDSNAAAGTPSGGLMQFIMPTFSQYAMPGHANWMNPVDQVAADAWSGGYIRSRYGSIDAVPGVAAVRAGGSYVGYDSGGWLPPGPVNRTGRPEAVLTPEESAAFVQAARSLAGGGGAGRPVVVNINGTQWPNSEQIAALRRELAMALGGA